jgi:transcriptional regulator GlxA family with amidase domain
MTPTVEILPLLGDPEKMALGSVAAVALPGVNLFELGVACEGFGIDRTDEGVPTCDFAVVSAGGVPVPTSLGWPIAPAADLDRADEADLVVVPAAGEHDDWPEPVLELLRRTVARGARVMSICTGAFVLGAAGLLDGRECTTHWRHAAELAARFPLARVDPNVLYVCDGPILTSAGTASGLDLCLHLFRTEYGERVANLVARRMVMPPYRGGGQAQYVDFPLNAHPADTLAPLLDDVAGRLDQPHTVESLARRAGQSPRTFARRFRAETGTTPHAWLTHQRVLLARRMLESGDDPVETVAEQTGFGAANMLRHHFTRIVGTSPAAYRKTFRGR